MLFPLCTRVYAGNAPARDTSTRKERNFIRQGNKHYNDKHFADAEILYRKALEENELSEAGQYNLALSLIRQAGNADPNNGNNPMAEAQALLNDLARTANNDLIAERSFYNLGNMYKGALRKNPDNDKARENLRLAQLKRQQQQDQQDNKQDKQDQDQQQQQQQQNQPDQQNPQDKNEDKDQQPQQPQDKKQQQPQQQQGGISDANAAKILKTMENEENATRRKIQEMEKKEGQASRRNTGPQW